MYEDYTPKQLETAEKRLAAESSALCSWFVAHGYGDKRRTELRKLYASGALTEEHAANFKRSFEVDDLQMRLYSEMEGRRAFHGSLKRIKQA